jgi:phospholipid/cholesterol/gamma-HCH transport system substrate-binding protein
LRIRTETAVGAFILAATSIFFYMSFQVGAFRFDRHKYMPYKIFFNDISGLSPKSDVKMAGVKIGWVDNLELVHDGQQVLATIMIHQSHPLYGNAYGMVRQEGLIGTKYLEVFPGDVTLPSVQAGSALSEPSRDCVGMDQLLYECRGITGDVRQVTHSFKQTLGGDEGAARLEETVKHFNEAARQIAACCQSLERLVSSNQETLASTLKSVQDISQHLKEQIPTLTKDVRESIQKISTAIDNDLDRVASSVEETTKPLKEVIHKINDGTGFVGQLVNDTDTSRDIQVTVQNLKECFSKLDNIALSFDTHVEALRRLPGQSVCDDFKGYCNAIIFPQRDYFCLVGATATRRGLLYRDKAFQEHSQDFSHDSGSAIMGRPHKKYCSCTMCSRTTREFDKILLNLQLGALYNNFAFRFGVFEGFGGIGLDYDIPLPTDSFRWITSFEAFDFTGCNRVHDNRPHLKWINRLFFTNNLYGVIGFDDFISRNNKTVFFGLGFCFSNDDITYLFRNNLE